MAIDATEKTQSYDVHPSVVADQISAFVGDVRRRLAAVFVDAGLMAHSWIAPWDGVIESIRTTQLLAAAGGGAQNSLTLTVATVTAWEAATDGNTLLDNVAAEVSALTYPTSTALLVEQADGFSRLPFVKGDVIALGAVAAGTYGTAETEIMVAKVVPHIV